MNFSFLKKIVLAFLILSGVLSVTVHAQSNGNYFIYIQAKDKLLSYYVILNGSSTVYSSNAKGYLLIPKLKSGVYDLKIGFPEQTTEEDFTCVINDNMGYSLQKNNNGEWTLIDRNSQAVMVAKPSAAAIVRNRPSGKTVQGDNPPTNNAQLSAFSSMLSNVAGDSTLNAPVAAPQTQTAATPVADNTAVNTSRQNVAVSNVQTPYSPTNETYGIIKSSEINTGDGLQMTFVLFNSRATDTVQILIPEKAPEIQQPVAPPPVAVEQSYPQLKNTLPLFNYDDNNAPSVNNPPAANANRQSVLAQCDNPLTDRDMLKLQKKILSKTTDDDMLSAIDKVIKGKCVVTEQIRQLGASFLSDAGRFALYQDAYGNVTDKENYPSLQNQLLDNYFKKRFADMFNQ